LQQIAIDLANKEVIAKLLKYKLSRKKIIGFNRR